jgi:hypothetical protein
MYARVATFEGADTENVREVGRQINAQDGPPEGLPSVGLLILHNADGKVQAISLFETEEDLETGDAHLSAMEPPVPGGLGRRVSIERFEVAVKRDAGDR